jgi:transcriptional regulator with XRE-family HTH domain
MGFVATLPISAKKELAATDEPPKRASEVKIAGLWLVFRLFTASESCKVPIAMPPAQVQELVSQVKAWYEANQMLQRDLAAKLGVSPTGLCQIFAGVNQPSAATTLKMIQFLEQNKSMKTNYLDPRATPRPTASDDRPKTLGSAIEKIDSLQMRIKQLEQAQPNAAAASPGKPASVPASAKAKAQPAGGDPGSDPTYPPTGTPGASRPNKTEMESGPAAPSKALSVTANTPVLIQKILDVTTLDDLRLLLNNPAHTPTQQACIYAEIKKRRDLVANRFQ